MNDVIAMNDPFDTFENAESEDNDDFDEEWTSGEFDKMNKRPPTKKKRLDDEEGLDEDDEDIHEEYYDDEEDEDEDMEVDTGEHERLLKAHEAETRGYESYLKADAFHRTRRPRPPRAPKLVKPLPPLPPLPPIPDFELASSKKVFGIRGLDPTIYKDITKIARKHGVSVAELVNRIFAQYRYASEEESQVISGLRSLEIHEDELQELNDNPVRFVEIQPLIFGADVSSESFKKIKEIKHIGRLWVPSHLYLLALKKARMCERIEKYKGDTIPRIVSKSFNGDVKLTSEFFEFFIENEEKVSLVIYGELEIEENVSVDDLKATINSLRVDSDIRVPRHLIGWMYAKAECYGEIEPLD
jgi:hypothetical protein